MPKIHLPRELAPALAFVQSDTRDRRRCRAFWHAMRAGRRFDARAPLHLLDWAERRRIGLESGRLVLLVLTGFRRPLLVRIGWTIAALVMLAASLAALWLGLERPIYTGEVIAFGNEGAASPSRPRIPGLDYQVTREVPASMLGMLPPAVTPPAPPDIMPPGEAPPPARPARPGVMAF